MLNNWINVTRISIRGADRLYPKGLDWHVAPGVNAVVGGTGLGKTTFVYALQFAVFGKLVVGPSERIEREFFRDRLTKRSRESLEKDPPAVRVEFSVGLSKFVLTRLLLSGTLVHTLIYEQKKGVKLGDTFRGICTLMNPLDWSQNSTAILQAASRADLPN